MFSEFSGVFVGSVSLPFGVCLGGGEVKLDFHGVLYAK